MRVIACFVVATVSFITTFAKAGEPMDLLPGYGKAKWGQTADEVQELYGDKIQGFLGYGSGPAADLTLPAEASVIDLKLPEPEPLVESVVFRFLEGRLCAVKVHLTVKAQEATSNEILAKVVWDKYFADPKIRTQLQEHHLLIWLSRTGRKPDARGPGDLVPKEQIISDVWYENQELWDQQVLKAKERKQQETQRATQAASEENLKKVL